MAASERLAGILANPFLLVYLAALIAVWGVSLATWSAPPGEALELSAPAAGLQYALAVVAATLAALQLRMGPIDDQPAASFGWFDYRWSIPDDIGGRAFWRALGFGVIAMEVNVALLILADLVVTGGAGGGSYLEWLGSGVAAGAMLGIIGAVVAAIVGVLLRRRLRR